VSRLRALAATLLAVLFGLTCALELHFVDVGQGDGVLIRLPDGRAVVYDAGPAGGVMLDYLRREGVAQVVLVVASHAHADHIGGLPDVIDAYAPGFVLDNGLAHTTATFERYLGALERSGALLLEPIRRTITLGDVRLHVLPSPMQPSWGHNDNSVGLIVEYGPFRASLTGDAEERLFAWWQEEVPDLLERVDVHKASHHGSDHGDTDAALARLRPEIVVVSAGRDNAYGHPHATALARYAAVGATVHHTDLEGTIVVHVTADGGVHVVAEREAPAPLPGAAVASGARAPACVDIDTAPEGSLHQIVHIDEARAADVVRARPFGAVEALTRIHGIGPARLRDILARGLAWAP
jgi:competence protein ComEC